jgi:hypothetical protein
MAAAHRENQRARDLGQLGREALQQPGLLRGESDLALGVQPQPFVRGLGNLLRK